ncbi:MAG: hypothetical protein ACTSPI_16520, partial [Candidatus Heimdallarchaeaceae archaeon]
TELIDVGKIVGKLIDSESIIKTAIRLCDHNLHRLKIYHQLEMPKETILCMKSLLQGKEDLTEKNHWLDVCEKLRMNKKTTKTKKE